MRPTGPSGRPSGPQRPSGRPSGPGGPRPGGNRSGGRPPFNRGAGGRTPFIASRTTSTGAPLIQPKEIAVTPNNGAPVLRFVPLGGLEEVGRNCSYYEYGDEIIVVDVGVQFAEESTPGADWIIPNMASLEPKKKNIRGLIITHGHMDHFGAIHYLIEKMGNPIIYTSRFAKAIIEKRHEEFPNAPKLRFQVVNPGDKIKLSEHFEAEFFAIEHTIPEAYGFILSTPVGNMVSFGDYRLDMDENGAPTNLDIFKELGRRGVHSLFLDSTAADRPGHGPSEAVVEMNLEKLMKGAQGRIIITMFSTLVDRAIQTIHIAKHLGRKIALNGRSMTTNIDLAKNMGYLKGSTDHVIKMEDIGKYKDHQLVILTAGAQGEPNSGFMRIARGEHRLTKLKPQDTVIFSSSVIPGNERSVQALQDNISRQVEEIYNSKLIDIHAGGHAHWEDHALILEIIKPKFVVPIHGHYFMRKSFNKIAEQAGLSREQVRLIDNGQISELHKDRFAITDQKVPSSYVIVDGLGVGDVEEVVLRDRVNLSQEGMIVLILTLDRQTSQLVKAPDVISRGFIHLRDNTEIIDEMRKRVRTIMSRIPGDKEVEADYVKMLIRDQIGQFIYQRTHRRPMLLPVVIEI